MANGLDRRGALVGVALLLLLVLSWGAWRFFQPHYRTAREEHVTVELITPPPPANTPK